MRDSRRVLLALVAALAGGAAIAASGNATLLRIADVVSPIGTIWVNAIRMTVIPLVVSLLITGVATTSELRTIGRMGGRTIAVFASLLAGVGLLIVPVATFVFERLSHHLGTRPPLPAGAVEAASLVTAEGGAQTFATWLTSLVPSNPVAAAANGAMIPLIVFSVLLALAIARSPTAARERLVGFFEALRDAMLVLVGWIVAAAPIGVFALLLPIAARGGTALVGGVGFYIAAYSITSVITVLALYPVVAIAGRMSMARFARAALPAQLIAFSSSSSIASLPALIESAERELGLETRISGFVLPLAVSIFKLVAPVSWTIGALFVAWFYGIDLRVRDLVTIDVAGILLAFAAPGVPRGAFLMLAPLFIAIGLPIEGLGILIAVDAIPDLFATVVNVTGDLVAAVIVAGGAGVSGAGVGTAEVGTAGMGTAGVR
jgi:proton glutamate symport protein